VPLSDADLISAARSGDPSAYGTLYERHVLAARRVAGQLVRAPADVDDVVAETFARMLRLIRKGGGPTEAFRPYLLTAVRRVAIDHLRGQSRQIPTDEPDLPDPGEPFVDPVIASLDNSLIVRAFRSLPERWTAVLWHTEVEEARPAEVALLLGLTANGLAALRYRAREGLRQAYLQMHLADIRREECRPVADKLGAHVRGALSRRDARWVDSHLRDCADCRAAAAELASINGSLRGVLAPVFLGGAAAAYLSGSGASSAAGAAATPAAATPGAPAAASPGATPGGAGTPGAATAGGTRMRLLRLALARRPVIPIAAGTLLAAIAVPAGIFAHSQLAPAPGGARAGGPPSVLVPGSRSAGTSPAARGTPGGHPVGSPTGPAGSSSGSPAPPPTASATPTTSASPTGSPVASPTPSASSPLLAAQLSVQVDVTGVLGLGLLASVVLHVTDTGTAPTGSLAASITLPSGIELLHLTGGGSGAHPWKCSTSVAGVASCSHGSIAAGAQTSATVQVLVTALSGCGNPVLATVVSGVLSASGQSASTVKCG
jgi:RNA polymerase sigma factor (sigma-70 family)